VINMPDRPYIDVRLASVKFLFRHGKLPTLKNFLRPCLKGELVLSARRARGHNSGGTPAKMIARWSESDAEENGAVDRD
jgi:hypothetical protein